MSLQTKTYLSNILCPLHKLLKILGLIHFEMDYNTMQLRKSSAKFQNYLLVILSTVTTIFNFFVLAYFPKAALLVYIIFLIYLTGDLFKSSSIIIICVIYKEEMMKIWESLIKLHVDIQVCFGTPSFKNSLKKFKVLIFLPFTTLTLTRVLAFLYFHYEYIAQTNILLVPHVLFPSIMSLYSTSNISIYVVFTTLIGLYHMNMVVGIEKFSRGNSDKLEELKLDGLKLEGLLMEACRLHQELTKIVNVVNKVLSLQLLALIALNFWTLSVHTYNIISTIYGSRNSEDWMSPRDSIYWVLDSGVTLMGLIIPGHYCSVNVRYFFCNF